MTLPPRAVLVHRRTELTELLDRHGTRGQAAFFLTSRGRRIEDVAARHQAVQAAVAEVAAAIPAEWRRGQVERADLPRFLFEPGDIVVVVGQDGLVANLAKYLDGQPVIGINPEPSRNPGVLVPSPARAAAGLLAAAASPHAAEQADQLSMVQAATDDGQQLTALNEIYIGQPTHQTARYTLARPGGRPSRRPRPGSSCPPGPAPPAGAGRPGWSAAARWRCPRPPSRGWPGSSARRGRRPPPAPARPRVSWPRDRR